MSKHLFERFELGYAGEKKPDTLKGYTVNGQVCTLPWCNNKPSRYKGVGSRMCEHHQSLMREYGGPARTDRPYTFNKKRSCDKCGFNPWTDDPLLAEVDDVLIKDRLAWGTLIVDHIHTQRDGGNDNPENCQTLCVRCNQHKTTLACDSMPKTLYSSDADYNEVVKKLKPIYDRLFN